MAETKVFTLYSLEEGVLFFDYHDNINIELDDVKEAFSLFVKHSNNCTFKVLLAFGQFSTIDVEARKYAENKSMPTPAQAIVIRNLSQRMLARFYHLLRKDKHLLKFVRSVDEGLTWLMTISPDGNSQASANKELLN
ncbi:MAG: hypothetical protein P8P74_14490 [Crocinitomicaceae bacterium]|nr:hypothetical protein [Crocinitomicaceae bacterium]